MVHRESSQCQAMNPMKKPSEHAVTSRCPISRNEVTLDQRAFEKHAESEVAATLGRKRSRRPRNVPPRRSRQA